MSSDRTGEMTIREGAAWLGMGDDHAARKRLLRRLLAREVDVGHQILIRTGSRYKVTKAMLQAHLPEHFSEAKRIEAMLRGRLRDLRLRIDEVGRTARLETRELGWQIAALRRELDQVRRRT
jgi:hypothetical protein